jgi:hypothetical protein
MEQRATTFVEVMVVIAIIGILAFLIGLLVRAPLGSKAAAGAGTDLESSPRWYEFTLALILLAAIAAFLIWLISSSTQWVWGETIEDWRSDTRATVFAGVMVGLAVIGLVASLAYALTRSPSATATPRRSTHAAPSDVASSAAAPARSGSPLGVLGLLAVVIAVVLLCWIGLPAAAQYGLLANLIYPASLGVALVLLFDKATRTWGSKRGAVLLREWLLCDLLVFLLILAFLNLHNVAKPDGYAGSFWDLLNIVVFFIGLWTLDRSAARGRFLGGYGYLVVLPLLLLIWQSVQGVPAPASWWASAWPFLILAGVFFVLEAITLVASSEEQQTLPAIKDASFVVLYGVLLIVAAKSA